MRLGFLPDKPARGAVIASLHKDPKDRSSSLAQPASPSTQRLLRPKAHDFRGSDEYRALDAITRDRLEKVVADFALLEKALSAFMEDHKDVPPRTLADLIPKYLKELPNDPFADGKAEFPYRLKHFARSLDGQGYLYSHSASSRAWDIRSIGLANFPLRYGDSNPGLIKQHGYWWPNLMLDVF